MPQTSQFTGNVTLWSSLADFPGPKVSPVSFKATFDDASGKFTITDFAAVEIRDIVVRVDGEESVNDMTATVPLIGHGQLDLATGRMSIEMNFRFSHTLPEAPSSLALTFSTDGELKPKSGTSHAGGKLDRATGDVTLHAEGKFDGGTYLNDITCWVLAELRMVPVPNL